MGSYFEGQQMTFGYEEYFCTLFLLFICLSDDAVNFALGLLVFFRKKWNFLFKKKCPFIHEMVIEKVLCWKYFPYCIVSAKST